MVDQLVWYVNRSSGSGARGLGSSGARGLGGSTARQFESSMWCLGLTDWDWIDARGASGGKVGGDQARGDEQGGDGDVHAGIVRVDLEEKSCHESCQEPGACESDGESAGDVHQGASEDRSENRG